MTQILSQAEPVPSNSTLPPEPDKAFSATDGAVLFGLPLLAAVSWCVPERHWPGLCRRVAPLAVPMHAGDPEAAVAVIRRTLGDRNLGSSPEEILEQLSGEQILSILQLLRDYRPGGWTPEIRLIGGEHIEAARQRGHGLVFWVGYSVYGDLVAKMAFRRAGLAVSHLTRASHGFSATRFGTRYLNRIQTAVEDHYLGERVSLTINGAKGALTLLETRLRDNSAVSFTVHRNAQRPVTVPFLSGEMHLAPGAPVLAHKTKAALLPVFAYRDEAGLLTVAVEPPLEMNTTSTSKAVEQAAEQYAAGLEPYVLEYPGQWRGWLHL